MTFRSIMPPLSCNFSPFARFSPREARGLNREDARRWAHKRITELVDHRFKRLRTDLHLLPNGQLADLEALGKDLPRTHFGVGVAKDADGQRTHIIVISGTRNAAGTERGSVGSSLRWRASARA